MSPKWTRLWKSHFLRVIRQGGRWVGTTEDGHPQAWEGAVKLFCPRLPNEAVKYLSIFLGCFLDDFGW